MIRVITVVKMPVHVPKKHAAEISDPKTAWNEVIGCDILPQRPVIPRKNIVTTDLVCDVFPTSDNGNNRKNTV